MSDPEIVTVEPGRWVPVATDGEGAGRMVTEVFHVNPDPVGFVVADEPVRGVGVPGGRLVRVAHHESPPDGYRVRVIPFEDSTYQRFVQDSAPPPNPPDALRGHTLEQTARALLEAMPEAYREEAVSVAERRIRENIEKGWVREVGPNALGEMRYELTAEGAKHAERSMGMPPGSIPVR